MIFNNIVKNLFTKTSFLPKYYFNAWTAAIPQGPADPVLGVEVAYKKDKSPNKVNLGIGAYRDDDGKPVVLESVRSAERIIFESDLDNEYLPVQGSASFLNAAVKLGYGPQIHSTNGKKIAACQVLSGTGALKLGFDFVKKFVKRDMSLYVPNPTWPNHNNIARDSGFQVKEYTYYNPATKRVNFNGLHKDLENMPEGQFVLFHACAHNPTGCDLTTSQWKDVAKLMHQKNHIVFLDMAYQGFTSGDTEKDNESVKILFKQDVPVLLGQSFAKSMGLYGQRIGCLSIPTQSEAEAEAVTSQLKIIARAIWSNPPLHGARIAETILTNENLNQLWHKEVAGMANRISAMRKQLVENLQASGSQHDWSHITTQRGMFAYTGLKPEHCKRLIEEFHIYLMTSGRISVAGLNTKNVAYVAKAFHEVTKNSTI